MTPGLEWERPTPSRWVLKGPGYQPEHKGWTRIAASITGGEDGFFFIATFGFTRSFKGTLEGAKETAEAMFIAAKLEGRLPK